MVIHSGERWHCIDLACRCTVIVEAGTLQEGGNPRCSCGSIMKKDFNPPIFSYLDFLKFDSQFVRTEKSDQEWGPLPERNFSRSRRKNLRIQADVPHTFGPILVALAVILVFCGGFLLEGSVTHRLESDPMSILFGSAVLACGLLLVSFLLRSLRISTSFAAHTETIPSSEQPDAHRGSPKAKVLSKAAPPPRPFHRFYVDETRVSR
jgi:hypothetical protein